MNEELEQKVDELSRKIDEQSVVIRDEIEELKNKKPIDRYLDNQSKSIIEDIINVRFVDILFDNIYYYNSWFDSIDGMESTGHSYSAAGLSILGTAGTGVDEAFVAKTNPVILNAMDFTKESRFRVSIQPRATTNQNIKAVVGDYNTEAYGFEIEDATLKGFTHDDSSGTTKDILTISANNNYTMEARFFPGERVDFVVNDVNYVSITATLPSDINAAEILWSVAITEQEAVVKELELGGVEYIQSRI